MSVLGRGGLVGKGRKRGRTVGGVEMAVVGGDVVRVVKSEYGNVEVAAGFGEVGEIRVVGRREFMAQRKVVISGEWGEDCGMGVVEQQKGSWTVLVFGIGLFGSGLLPAWGFGS